MKIDGRCHCGKIVYQAEVDPDMLAICHCTDCQVLAGSAYRATIPARAGSFVLLRGEPKIYLKTAESGNVRAHGFCADCGTPIYAATPGDSQHYSLRLGAIQQRAQLRPRRQIWCQSALGWAMDLGGIEKRDRQ
jgi:hypothetical protein